VRPFVAASPALTRASVRAMKSLCRAGFGLLLVGSAFAFAGCGDDDDTSPGASGKAAHGGEAPAAGGSTGQGGAAEADGIWQCKVVGELCHEADTGSGDAHDCHELGHVSDGAACAQAFAGCVETCVDESAGKEPLCASLGELCHAVDDETGPLHECHELGHVNDKATCAAEFDHCAEICLAARELLEHEDGAAGSGGASVGGAGAGGAGGAR
jgi:hypothetical protein